MIEIALYQPDIPQNAATIIRLGACLGLGVHIIEPAGFVWSDRSFRRAGMDYLDLARVARHASCDSFMAAMAERRIILLTTAAGLAYCDFAFAPGDVLLLGRESGGVPARIHATASERLRIPMQPGTRSLNIALACAMVTGEALRQIDGWPGNQALHSPGNRGTTAQ